jgi:LAO/AO transport system kinase
MGFETNQISDLANRVVEGEDRAIAQAISMCENDSQSAATEALIAKLWRCTDDSITVGITGPPGVGKSTLVSGLVEHVRTQDQSVGVIAIDPSSQFTNGALLGDRIRMTDHTGDQAVFIRSMSNRGHLGGTAETTFLAMTVLAAAGKDVTIVETVGVGQSEVEVHSLVDTVVVVLQPDSGDSIQAIKSGLMEIPDVICLNKIDRSGASKTSSQLKANLLQDQERDILFTETAALSGRGIDALWAVIQSHRKTLGEEGLLLQRRANLLQQLATIATARLTLPVKEALLQAPGQALVAQVEQKAIDPLNAVQQLLDAVEQNH